MSRTGWRDTYRDASGEETGAKDNGIRRRTCLRVLGTTAASTLGLRYGSGQARAADSGYGTGGFGEGPYGDPTDGSSLSVSTKGTTDVGTTSATLDGSLDELGTESSVTCYFEYREEGTSDWKTTAGQTLSATGPYSETVSGLSRGTTYEFRAVADGSDQSDAGTIDTFTTGSAHEPTIDSFVVTEAGSPNPHAEITADWEVSDEDGDLDAVRVDVTDAETGSVVDSNTTHVSGYTASSSDEFKVKNADGKKFEVGLVVADANPETADSTASETVTE